jgi:hypothetical protein
MEHIAQEITREYRLNFNDGEAHWDDRIPPEVTSGVLGRGATCAISRTSLLAWSLMNISEVQMADVVCGGWIKIVISTGPDFDELAFTSEVAQVLSEVSAVRSNHRPHAPDFALPKRAHGVIKAVGCLTVGTSDP